MTVHYAVVVPTARPLLAYVHFLSLSRGLKLKHGNDRVPLFAGVVYMAVINVTSQMPAVFCLHGSQVIPMPMPNMSPRALVECFWQAKGRFMRYETQSHILRLLVSTAL